MCRSCITISCASCSQTWQGDMAETPKRPIAASDDCLKRDKKRRLLKHKALEVHIFRLSNGGKYTPYGLFYFHCIVVSADSKSSPFFRGYRFFFLFSRFESTSSAKVSYYATSLMSIIILSNTQIQNYARICLIKYRSACF